LLSVSVVETVLPNSELTTQQIKLIEITKLKECRDTELRGVERSPLDFPCPGNGPNCKLVTDTLKGPHGEVSGATCDLRACVDTPGIDFRET
jgi:hypothetical protein